MTAPCTCPAAPDGSCAHCGRIGHDHPKASAGISVEIAIGELGAAIAATSSLRRALTGAHEACSHLTGVED